MEIPNGNQEVTRLLQELSQGSQKAVDALIPLVYESLQRVAHNQLRHERPDHTLRTQDLVHEAYFRLVKQEEVDWKNRAHFFAIASQAMRRILINYANQRKAAKRGGGQALLTLHEGEIAREIRTDELLALDEALAQLAALNERQSKVVEYRFFGGLKYEEIAEVLQVSVPSVRRDWRLARAWLSTMIEGLKD